MSPCRMVTLPGTSALACRRRVALRTSGKGFSGENPSANGINGWRSRSAVSWACATVAGTRQHQKTGAKRTLGLGYGIIGLLLLMHPAHSRVPEITKARSHPIWLAFGNVAQDKHSCDALRAIPGTIVFGVVAMVSAGGVSGHRRLRWKSGTTAWVAVVPGLQAPACPIVSSLSQALICSR